MEIPKRDRIRRYVLGLLPDGERETVEEALFDNDETFELLLAAEDELIDDCAMGVLSESDRRRFLQYVSVLPERDGELRAASALVARTLAEPGPSVGAPSLRRRHTVPWARMLAIAAVVTAFLSAAWTLSVLSRFSSDAQVRTSVSDEVAGNNSPLVLTPGRLRSSGAIPTRELDARSTVIEFRLDIPADNYETYRGVLFDSENAEIVALNRLRAHDEGDAILVSLALPTSVLLPGDYFVELSGILRDEQLEPLARYDFRLTSP